jgi:hypothetical protein
MYWLVVLAILQLKLLWDELASTQHIGVVRILGKGVAQ